MPLCDPLREALQSLLAPLDGAEALYPLELRGAREDRVHRELGPGALRHEGDRHLECRRVIVDSTIVRVHQALRSHDFAIDDTILEFAVLLMAHDVVPRPPVRGVKGR